MHEKLSEHVAASIALSSSDSAQCYSFITVLNSQDKLRQWLGITTGAHSMIRSGLPAEGQKLDPQDGTSGSLRMTQPRGRLKVQEHPQKPKFAPIVFYQRSNHITSGVDSVDHGILVLRPIQVSSRPIPPSSQISHSPTMSYRSFRVRSRLLPQSILAFLQLGLKRCGSTRTRSTSSSSRTTIHHHG